MGVTLPGGWASAMAQGQAMSLLARVAERGADGPYLEAAVRGLPPFRTTVDEGGLTGYLDGHPIYEEFPTQPPSFALNGFQFALLGLYDLAQAPVASDAQELFDSGIASLVWALPKYDTGGLSAYHLGHLTHPPRRMHRSLYYHYIHIQLLRALHCASGNPELEQYARRWLAYKPRRFDPS